MYVCICHAVTEKDIQLSAERGVRSMRQLRAQTGCSGTCGQCAPMAKNILEDAHGSAEQSSPESLTILPAFA
ncbi:MAG: (2Fe-2S)-binding protein [Pseudomonadota bacterium]